MSAERIGKLLAELGQQRDSVLENNRCPGALLRVSRKQAIGMANSGRYRWVMDPERIPEEGLHSWRIACRNEIMTCARTADLPPDASEEQRRDAPRYVVKYGLCSACNGMELAMRKYLRREQEAAAEAARGQAGRRRGFREEASE